ARPDHHLQPQRADRRRVPLPLRGDSPGLRPASRPRLQDLAGERRDQHLRRGLPVAGPALDGELRALGHLRGDARKPPPRRACRQELPRRRGGHGDHLEPGRNERVRPQATLRPRAGRGRAPRGV
ncbi:MAG: hypothetical protein AVDCRST_MAG05-1769, partial [uncultured Rubrobacteraceae bacterium]